MSRSLFLLFLSLTYFFTKTDAQSGFQSPYSLSYKLDLPIGLTGIGLNFAYFMMDKKSPALTSSEISLLDRNNINFIDRSASFNWSRPAAKASDFVMFGAIAAPALLYLDKNVRKDWAKVGVIWAETMALNTGITNLTKVLVKRTRPYVYNPNAPMDLKLKNDARYSFFSGHTSVTSSMCFMTAKIYSDYNPNSKALPYIWTGAAIIPATAAFLRWRAGKHYFTDVLTGYIVGAAVGILVPHLHKIID
jgi:membrane-associated phospholipid phosphatase